MRYTAIFLIALVSFTVAYHSPADAVLEKIDALSALARNEQAQQTKIYVSQHEKCRVEKAFRVKEVSDAEVAQGAADQQLQICRSEIPVARASRRQSVSELAATKEQLKALATEFSLYQQVTLARQQEHKEALNNIQTAYNIIGTFANGKSALSGKALFLEVSSKINSVYRTAVKHSFHQQMLPVIQAMIEMSAKPATQVSTSALQRVVKLLQRLEADVKHQEVVRSQRWTAYRAQVTQQKGLLNTQVKALGVIIHKYVRYLQSLHQCVRTESHIRKLAHHKLVRNANILRATTQMCNAFDAKFAAQTKQRTDYIALIGNLRSFVVHAISSFKGGLYSHGDFKNQ